MNHEIKSVFMVVFSAEDDLKRKEERSSALSSETEFRSASLSSEAVDQQWLTVSFLSKKAAELSVMNKKYKRMNCIFLN